MTDPATTPLPDPFSAPLEPAPPLVLLAADDAVVCVDDMCVSPGDEALMTEATASPEAEQ
jgi:hypothetical protein